ncbi:MAG: TetR/AcrR family transcriptional regulator [Spirochaetes bacterium]|nr:MAG: TetR/AcrR family transcriptional regulator [Spirochaetota bacterium]
MGKAELTRKNIIEESAPIFNRKGYAGTSISDLTEVLGLTKGALYGNFANKDEIAVEALAFNFSRIRKGIEEALAPIDGSCDKLIAFARYYTEHYRELAAGGGCPVLNASIDSDDGNPIIRKKVRAYIEYWRQNLERIVARGVRRGEMREGVAPAEFASLFITLIEGGIMLSKITGDRAHLDAAARHIEEHVNGALRA